MITPETLKLPAGDVWPNMIQGSEQWLKARKGRATASQAKKILTPTGKLSTQAEAYARQLARECVLENPFAFAGNRATDWGNEHEAAARMAFIEATGFDVIEVGFVTKKDNPILGCSPDGIVLEPCLAGLEIKCPDPDTLIGWMIDGVIPEEHLPQVHASMVVTGLRKWHFVGYFPTIPLFTPPPAVWDNYTDRIAAALDGFVIQYAKIRKQVLGLLGRRSA